MSVFAGSLARRLLLVCLVALVGLYLLWFGSQPRPWMALLVLAGPPALLAMAALRGSRTAAFWAGVFALGWFCHGVMVAWAHPPQRPFALVELALALVIVFASSVPGIRARFAKKKQAP